MATTGKKEYTLKINGIGTAVKDVTTLETAVNNLDTSLSKVSNTTVKVTDTAKKHTKSLTEEEKAAKKLEDTQKKIKAAQEGANDAQIKATQELREATREQTRRIQVDQLAEGSIKQMGMQLTDLRNKYEGLSRAEREDIAVGGELLQQIQALDTEYKTLRESTGNFRDSVGNYEKALSGLGKLSEGIEGVSKSSMGLAQGLLGANALMGMFGQQSEEDAKRAQQLQKIIALLSIAQQVNTNILKEGIVQNKLAVVTDAIRTAQLKAKTAAEVASTKGTIAATAAQKIFNAVAAANPYVLLALALVAVGSALAAFASGSGKARKEQAKLNAEIAYTNRILKQLNRDTELEASLAEARGESEEKVLAIRRRAAKEVLKIAEEQRAEIQANTKATKEQKDEAVKAEAEALTRLRELNDQATILEEKRRKEKLDKAKEAAKTEMDILRGAEDARIKLIQDSDELARRTLEASYDRQIEDLKIRLTTEKDLTVNARTALNETITSLEKQKGLDLEKLEKEQADRALALRQEVEDSRLALIAGSNDRQTAEINLQYDRQIEAYKKRLDEDKTLTEEQQKQITELITNAQKARGIALARLTSEQLNQQADQQLTAIEDALKKAENLIGETVARDKTGLELIDVEKTRNNLADANAALDEYIDGLIRYRDEARAASDATLATLQEGTLEYEAELQKRARVEEDVTERIKNAQTEQADNTQKSAEIQHQAIGELLDRITGYADAAVMALSSVFATWNMGLQVQIDDLNEQLDAVGERYEEAQKQREQAAKNVEDIEAQLQAATGGTAEALKAQLQDSMHAREEAAREEQRLAREKEKLEADLAKKEKKQKRVELLSNIAQGVANVAQGVTKAWSFGPLLGPILATVVATAGAIQVGIMTKQLTKLADGGEIKGPSHANGGVPIAGTNYEVEGGEFVVNKRSYGANASLVNFINDTPRAITASDLLGVVPGDTTPVIVTDTGRANEDRILEAINGINFRPVVSVTDINNVNDEVVTVKDLAGF